MNFLINNYIIIKTYKYNYNNSNKLLKFELFYDYSTLYKYSKLFFKINFILYIFYIYPT